MTEVFWLGVPQGFLIHSVSEETWNGSVNES